MSAEAIADMVGLMVRGGSTPDAALRRLAQAFPAEELESGASLFNERTRRVRMLRDPRTLQRPDRETWYDDVERDTDRYWPHLRDLLRGKDWTDDDIASLHGASSKVVSLLDPPNRSRINTRGLVIGYVQSGKTANYTAVMAKAADATYRFFIVLSGMLENLRQQTQVRLEQQLIPPQDEDWYLLTTLDDDFRSPGNPNFFLAEHREARILAVVKKQSTRLRYLLRWLREAREDILRNCPILIIDDEADQASVNAARYQDERTAINRLVVETLGHLPKVAYVAYTATPFANVLVNPADHRDIYPRDFIVDLPKPNGHFGPEDIFGREPLDSDEEDVDSDGLDMVREVPDDELADLQPPGRNAVEDFYPSMTESLDQALKYFLMATAARWVRGQAAEHSTMLLHSTLYTRTHERMQPIVEAHLRTIRARIASGELLGELRLTWEREVAAVSPESMGERSVSFDEIAGRMPEVLDKVEVLVDNARSLERLSYMDEGGTVRVVIGGNTLSRGLTLEGLVVSHFIRAATAYDTLLQMGRWFGYRRGYSDLPRIWLTTELEQWFRDLARVEAAIRADVGRFELENLTPEEFAVRIPTHPHLAITSALKMQHAIDIQVSYSGRRLQTIMFAHRDRDWLANNLDAGRGLIAALRDAGCEPRQLPGRWIFDRVSADHVLDFLDRYEFHERSFELSRKDLIRAYVEEQRAIGALDAWNVVVIGRRDGAAPLGRINLGLPEDVPLINRSKMRRSEPTYADIKALMSKVDWLADFQAQPSGDELKGLRDEQLAERRPAGVGLLVLYPVSKDSRPRDPREDTPRAPLDAVEDMLGAGLVFPKAEHLTAQSYVSVDLSALQTERDEWDPDLDEQLAEAGVELDDGSDAG